MRARHYSRSQGVNTRALRPCCLCRHRGSRVVVRRRQVRHRARGVDIFRGITVARSAVERTERSRMSNAGAPFEHGRTFENAGTPVATAQNLGMMELSRGRFMVLPRSTPQHRQCETSFSVGVAVILYMVAL